VNTTMTARTRGLRRAALAAGALVTAAAGLTPAAAHGQSAAAAATPQKDTVTVTVKRNTLAGKRVKFGGRIGSQSAGRSVFIQRRAGKGWRTIARTRTRAGGRYSAYWRAHRTGKQSIRAYVPGVNGAPAATRTLRGRVTVYVPRMASYYGPGLYGGPLACGGRLTPSTVGVAHKTLPCGTRVTLHNRGRTLTVRVIDRGPYVGGRYFDLTAATKRKLRFGSTGNVWSTR
jgi:rare lipoprotein A